MMSPLRNSMARSVARVSIKPSSSSSTISPSISNRTMTTKAERWTAETIKGAKEQNLIGDGATNKQELSQILPNIEARWKDLSMEQQYGIFRQLEEIQRKDWKELSIDEKKAAYYVSFGPHGPRKPITTSGQGVKTFAGVAGLIAATFAIFFGIRSTAKAPIKTMTTEWQEQSNERALEQKQNPITGISSDNYKGVGHVQKQYA